MIEVKIKDATLQQAASEGMDAFVNAFVDAIMDAIGGQLTAENITELHPDQVTLLAYHHLQEEVMSGGFVQLIHNGYGGFIFHNPFARAMREWGIPGVYKLVNKAHKLYSRHHEELEQDCTDDEFMALFEQYPQFDDYDDAFVENEEEWTAMVAHYVDEHVDNFAKIEQ